MHPWLIPIILMGAMHVGAVTKTWVPNTDFGNADNWNPRRLPCPADRIVFPPALDLSVLLPGGRTVLRELVLPRSGELLLPIQGELLVTGQNKPTENCPGSDLIFTRTEPNAWLNSRNWQQHLTGDVAVPHSERVPCLHDTVVFPGNASFRVQLPARPVTVGSFRIGDKELMGSALSEYLATDAGASQFLTSDITNQAIRVGNTCWDQSGCSCEFSSLLFDSLCRFERSRCEVTPPCLVPVQPLGHCCLICGAYLLLDYTQEFRLARLQSVVEKFLLKYPRVRGHVGKATGRELVQVTLVDVDRYKGDSSDAAAELTGVLEKNATLGLVRVMVYAAGMASTATILGRTMETVFGTFFAVVFTFALIFLVFVVYRHKRFHFPASLFITLRTRLGTMSSGVEDAQPFVFARFENVPGDTTSEVGEVELSLAAEAQPQEYEEPVLGKAFDNPMYGKLQGPEVADLLESTTAPRVVTHENPVYSELKRREDASTKAKQRGKGEEHEALVEDDDSSDGEELHNIMLGE